MNKENFQQFSDLLYFENYLQDDKANWLVAQHGYLFRRDQARLIAHALEQKEATPKHFPLEPIENGVWDTVQLEQNHLVLRNENGEEKRIHAVETPYQTNSVQTLFCEKFDTVFRIETKSLVKVLLILQRKLHNQDIALHDVDVVLNWQNQTLSLVLPNDTSTYQLMIEVEKAGEEKEITYAYLFFRDFFIHTNSFQKQVTCSVSQSYFTKIDYDEKTKAVLNHKRKRVEENVPFK